MTEGLQHRERDAVPPQAPEQKTSVMDDEDKYNKKKDKKGASWPLRLLRLLLSLVGITGAKTVECRTGTALFCIVAVGMPLCFVVQNVFKSMVSDAQHDHQVLEGLRTSTYQHCTKEEGLKEFNIAAQPRADLSEAFQRKLKRSAFSVTVLGPRGSGKTTLIQKELCGEKGVVRVSLASTETNFDLAVLRELGTSNAIEASFSNALVQLKKDREANLKGNKGKRDEGRPIIVFGVDSNASAQQVQALLLWSKEVQHERRQASIIIDISQARVSLNLDINLEELRTSVFFVPLMSKAEAEGMLSLLVSDDDAKYAVSKIGCLPLHIQSLVSRCEGDYTSFKDVVDDYKEKLQYQMRSSAQNFASAVKVNAESQVLFQSIWEGNAIGLYKLATALGISQTQVIQADRMAPHILQIDPFDKRVSFSSPLARTELLAKMKQQPAI